MPYDFKKLKNLFDEIAGPTAYATAFSNLLDHALLPFQYFPDAGRLQQGFEKWKAYRHRELLSLFLAELADLMPEGFRDPLGEFYMQEISTGRLGQYFTPEDIVDMIVAMNYDGKDGNGRSVLDPACGSGRFLLRMAKRNRDMGFYGADLDHTCCKMTLLNMLLNSLSGEVAHMDSLSNEFFVGYKATTRLVDGYHHSSFIEFTEPDKSAIWTRGDTGAVAARPTVIQGDLFKDIL